ncbi:pseudo histidine-containing phosphotransfer protein 2-like isoform X1 [Lycium ferocissimum]|uniref:pseudo histidine-containing phosphotransfer protein 2-like isoform X1 n=1 Tax=Lycium ferocissimum TaxID=112874 RepID=UPI0028167293|nr:pseudo histidine-containing phosphotransfer protein 2-like isoform X1 [Lycium ferocissimum]
MASDFARYIAHLRQSLFDEQLLDEQFHKFEKFETTNEGFLEEICDEYFQESSEFLVLVVPKLQGLPYNVPEIERLFNRFNSFVTGFGAVKVTHQINIMKDCLKRGDFEASKAAFEAIKRENELLQSRLESYFKTRKQGPPAEIEDRPEYGYMDSDSE